MQESGDAGPEFRAVTLAASFKKGVGLARRAWQNRDLVFSGVLTEQAAVTKAILD